MKPASIESILAAHKIDNPTDASLVRLLAAAASMPDEPLPEIMQRMSFPNASDAALAGALAEAVRVSIPAHVAPTTHWSRAALWVGLISMTAATATLGVKSLNDAKTIAALSATAKAHEELVTQQVSRLETVTQENSKFASTVGEWQADAAKIYTATTEKLIKENRELAAQVESLRATNDKLEAQLKIKPTGTP